jgi:hypothetical protein
MKIISTGAIALVVFYCCLAKGQYLEPTAKTNINEKTNLFDSSIEDFAGFQKQIESSRETATSGIKGKDEVSAGFEYIAGGNSKSHLEAEGRRLDGIRPGDLNSTGREEMVKSGIIEEIHVDYEKPLNIAHKRDAEKIAESSARLLDRIEGLLKELGVDCKSKKGNKVIEPEYFIQVQNESVKNTVYTQKFCEDLRNQYNCRDTVSLKCVHKAMKWNEWGAEREHSFGGVALYISNPGLFRGVHWKKAKGHKSKDKLHLIDDSAVNDTLATLIASSLGAQKDQVTVASNSGSENGYLQYTGRGCLHAFEFYKVKYKFREGNEICAEWSEDWTERCTLK